MADILFVEDEPEIAALVADGLREHGHTIDHAATADAGLTLAIRHHYDLAIVDRMLPGMDGMAMVRRLRERSFPTPVLILSGLCALSDRVEGLNAGGDDYLCKPFAFSELLARVNALLRRANQRDDFAVLRVSDLEINLIRRKVTRANRTIELLPKEFELLVFLMRSADTLVTRTMLIEGVWNYRFDPGTNIVETHISRLRGKIGTDLIRTVRGAGYILSST